MNVDAPLECALTKFGLLFKLATFERTIGRKIMQLSLLFFFFSLASSTSSSRCPEGFQEYSRQCLHVSKQKLSFCKSHAHCYRLDASLIDNMDMYSTYRMYFPSFDYWVGLTNFLKKGHHKTGWRWSDNSILKDECLWYRNDPNEDTDCARSCNTKEKGKLCDHPCSASHFAVCYPKRRLSSFGSRFVLTTDYTAAYTKAPCMKKSSTSSQLHCARQCQQGKFGYCVSFYFNKTTRTCILVFFDDANIKLENHEEWRKFVLAKAED